MRGSRTVLGEKAYDDFVRKLDKSGKPNDDLMRLIRDAKEILETTTPAPPATKLD